MKEIFIIIISLLLFACNEKSKLEYRIETYIDNNCHHENCVVNLTKVVPFKWKHFYVFKETASLEEVEKVLNRKYPYFSDVSRRLIFLDYNNNIVYHEDIFPDFDGASNKSIVFHMPDTVNFKVYNSLEFKVKKEKLEKGYYYMLY